MLVDTCILPEYQGKGIGDKMLAKAMQRFYTSCPPGAYLQTVTKKYLESYGRKVGLKPIEDHELTMYAWQPI